jgi:hypothetical protein
MTKMRVDVVNLAGGSDREIALQQPERLAHDRGILAAKIDQVGGMDDAPLDPRLAAHLCKRGERRWIELCHPIATRVAGENLDCSAAE